VFGKYDERRRRELLSLGNRFVRNVKPRRRPPDIAYIGVVDVTLHDRRAPRWPVAVGVVLLALLAALGTLQYRWLGEVSEAERARMRESLQTRANDFAADFDRELTRTYLAFHVDSDTLDRDAAKAMAAAYAAAQSAGTVRIVKAVYLLEGDRTQTSLRRLDPAAATLTTVAWPPELARWRQRVEAAAPAAAGPVSGLFLGDAVDAATPALLIPAPRVRRIENEGHVALLPDPSGVARAVLVQLDPGAITSQLLGPLFAKHFTTAGPDRSDYAVWIVSRDDPGLVVFETAKVPGVAASTPADVTTGLFDLRMDDVSRVAAGLGIRLPERRVAAAAAGHVTTDKLAITIVRRANGPDGARVLMTGGDRQGAWQLRARHKDGSLEAIVAQSRRRNLAIGLGVLGLLAASFVLIVAAALRQQRLARQQMEFVAAVSHELRTPLAVICSAGENLADGVVADAHQVKRYGSLIETEGRRLGDMVERVLHFAGITSGSQTRARAEVDLGQVIADAVHGVSADARERGVGVVVHPHAALPPTIGDAEALRSAVQNIVGNAVKYSAGGGTVDVIAEVGDDGVVKIGVADHGLGIDAADLPHIFKPFFRGRRAVEAQVRGSGVGLSVVRHVVQIHGGDVHVDSRAGEGTTVTIVLPVQSSADASQSRAVRLRPGAVS
jgi:signal transduction histidine kinase